MSEKDQVTAPVAGGGVLSAMNCAVIALDDYSMESKRQPSPTAARLRSAVTAVAELVSAADRACLALPVLATMLRTANLAGVEQANAMLSELRAALSNIEGGKA